VFLDRAVVSGGLAAQQAAGGWSSTQVFAGQIAPQLGFGISAKGLFAAAYFDSGTSRLYYTESSDGSKWSTPTAIDNSGLTGQYPSLAFDASGDPAVAYYRCARSASATQCDPTQDGLYLARRKAGAWSATAVHADASVTDGLYPALAFAGSKAVIAFQVKSFDAASQASSVSWWVAEEQ
jgi:hypothetical protein